MPISNRIASFQTLSCGGVSYGVLIFLSEGCSPVRARLHTRYAPVRRSPAKYCYFLLPLDLHVLGLSLAFILSQDQTLRCMTFLFCIFWGLFLLCSHEHLRLFLFGAISLCQRTFTFCLFSESLSLFRLAVAKVRTFFVSLQIFFQVFFRLAVGFVFEPYVCRLEVDFGVEFLSESECKGRGLVFYFQIFGGVFFDWGGGKMG